MLKGVGRMGRESKRLCMGMRCQCWLLKAREVTVTLVTSLRREGIGEATKTLL